jgi:1-acyl-sn-glycerol-3-phosphate acyltransferase
MKRFKIVMCNIYFYVAFLLLSAVCIPTLTILVGTMRIFLSHRQTMKRFRRAISWYGKVIVSIPFFFIKLRYEDLSGAAQAAEPCIFVSNHRSTSDAFLMCVLPHEVVQVVNSWPFRLPVLGFYAKLSGYLNINNMPPDTFFEKARRLIEHKVSIAFFPEGTRSGGRNMGNFHGSAFRLALMSKAPIAPLCISGNENIPRKGSLLLQPGIVTVRRLPAIFWEEYRDMSVFTLKNMVRDRIARELELMENNI